MLRRTYGQGCGKGYDVAMLALHRYDVYGIEISARGAGAAEAYARAELQNPQSYNFGDTGPMTPDGGPGSVTILAVDFFSRDWERDIPAAADGTLGIDLIYDYTVSNPHHHYRAGECFSNMPRRDR